MIEIWVPIVNDAIMGCYRPDMPGRREADGSWRCDFPWATDEGAPTNFGDATFGPATKHFNVLVDPKDAPKCVKRVPDGQVPEEDKLLVGMIRHCRGDVERKADSFFDGLPNVAAGSIARRRMVKRLLIHAVHRGLSPRRAEEIRTRLQLPLAARADGIDGDIHEAGALHYQRARQTASLPEARAAVNAHLQQNPTD